MWYEMLPTFGLLLTGMYLYAYTPIGIRYLMIDKYYHWPKNLRVSNRLYYYQMLDEQKNGTVYKYKGLDAIPDKK